MTLHQDKLFGDVVKCRRFIKGGGPLGIERFAHVETVEPHLPWINLLMPKTAFRRARVCFQLLAKKRSRFAILFLLRFPVEHEQVSSGKDMVDVVLVDRVSANGTVVRDEVVQAVLNKLEILLVTGVYPNALDSFQHQTMIVGPFGRITVLFSGRVSP